MSIRAFYANKNIFLTGATGFLGKVILEKLLRAIPDIGTVYLLIRKKKNILPAERLKKGVFNSACFDKLRKMHANFEEFSSSKVVPIEGDIDKEGLGLSEKDRKVLIENVHVVINCAATVDFNARLDVALQMNVLGAMRMLELGKQMRNLESFVHVSTCYVNSDKRGIIEEKIYHYPQDPNVVVKEILEIPPDQLESRTPSILKDFLNTYTFTKSLGERLLEQHRQHVPLTIVRPAIIGSAWKEPVTGWVDAISAAGALYLLGGVGLVQVAKGDNNIIGDQIPVDFCADAVIVAAAAHAKNKETKIIHCGTSASNPVSWGYANKIVKGYWRTYPPQKKVAKCGFRLEKNDKRLKAEQFVRRLPVLAFNKVAALSTSASLKKSAGKLYKMTLKSEELSDLFSPFTSNEWVYLNNNFHDLQKYCSKEELDIFQLDTKVIEWKRYLTYFCWGLHHFVLKENVDPPTEVDRADVLLTSGDSSVSTVAWAFSRGNEFQTMSKKEFKSLVLNSERVKNTIKTLVVNKQANMSDQQFENYLFKIAEKNCDFIFSNYDVKYIRAFGLIIHSVFKTIYDKIVVDKVQILKLKQSDAKTNGPLILMPTHRSYVDFLVISYILFAFSAQCPQIVAAEDFLNMALVPLLLRGSGAFFIRRKKQDYFEIYNAILYEYIQKLLMTENWLEFFIEGTRSRYGKTHAPKLGILSIVVDSYLDGKIPNAQIVPITINYDKVLEGDSFPAELLGEQKVKESLSRLVKAANVLKMNFGRIFVDISDPIALDKYVEQYKGDLQGRLEDNFKEPQQRLALVKDLGYEIVYRLNENLVVMLTSVVASLFLVYRKGITEETLNEKVEWLLKQILARKGKIGTTDENFSVVAIKTAIGHLQHLVEHKKQVFSLKEYTKEDNKNVLMLSYYRNMLGHIFWNESIVACALASFGQEMALREGVTIERLWEEVSFLQSLVYREFQMRVKITERNLLSLLRQMADREVLSLSENGETTLVKVNPNGAPMMTYLCNLIWPFVSCYWVTSIYLFSMRNRNGPVYMKNMLQEVQWFAESMYDEKIIDFYEACALDTIKNALSGFKEMKVISSVKKQFDKNAGNEEILSLIATESELKSLEAHIKRFSKLSFNKHTDTEAAGELAKKTELLNYISRSKL